jgi:hypothetical protein
MQMEMGNQAFSAASAPPTQLLLPLVDCRPSQTASFTLDSGCLRVIPLLPGLAGGLQANSAIASGPWWHLPPTGRRRVTLLYRWQRHS